MVKPSELQAAFDLDFVPPALSPSEDYYPGRGIPAVVNAAERVVEILYWGLIPPWADRGAAAAMTAMQNAVIFFISC